MIATDKWEWFGSAGHFICGRWCRFHLCTLVGNVLVSTVGEYVHPARSGASEAAEAKWLKENWPGEDIGYGRKYETMVFNVTGERCADPDCGCNLPTIVPTEIDGGGYNTAGDAARGHMELCRKWASSQE